MNVLGTACFPRCLHAVCTLTIKVTAGGGGPVSLETIQLLKWVTRCVTVSAAAFAYTLAVLTCWPLWSNAHGRR